MPSRQDQLHSYQFMVQRVVAALVMRETDPARSPFRQAAGATLASLLIAVIGLGGAAAYGALVGGGSTGWREPGVVIVEKESGARYVYREERLHLVLNYPSALLIVGSAEPRTVRVSRSSISGVPRGVPLGIPDALDALPAADALTEGAWTICSALPEPGGEAMPRSALLVGVPASGGTALGERALLARHPDGGLHLIWQNRRHLIRDRALVLSALTWTSERPVPVAPALLNALPVGVDLARIPIPGAGDASIAVAGAMIGEVFVVERQGGGRQYAVAKRDGLAPINEVQANLLLTAGKQADPTPLSQGRFAGIRKLPDLVPPDVAAPPATTPQLVNPSVNPPGGAVCGHVGDDSGVREVRTGVGLPELTDASRTAARTAQGGVLADHVLVPAGAGAVVEAVAAPGATGGVICVVTDLGRRHAVAGSEVLGMLGYGAVPPVRLPASLVALVPAGLPLDPAAARVAAVPE